jgi:cellulose synthase/poly-beta-1,6-N-acetylglucosamine synthase-like glycosyltransferase
LYGVFLNLLIIIGLVGLFLPTFGYPILIWVLSAARSFFNAAVPESSVIDDNQLPAISFIISAYNEEVSLREKLENTMDLDYPKEKIEVVVLSDASTDQTDVIASAFGNQGVRLMRAEGRVGKSANLSRFVPQTKGSILVFSDANSIYQSDAVKRLIRHFSDPKIGYVVGAQRYRPKGIGSTHDTENQYWEMELKIKEWESNVSSVVGADGAIFAMRRYLFEPLEDSDISDFLGPLRIVSIGYRGVFEPAAICYEASVTSMSRNFERKVRIITRSLQAIFKVPSVLMPWRVGWFAIQVWLHKVLRWFSPVFLILLVVGAVFNASRGEYAGKVVLGGGVVWIFLASLYLIPRLRRNPLVSAGYYFGVINAAAFVGLISAFCGKRIHSWKPDR